MSNEIMTIPVKDIETMARAMAASKLFGVKTPDEAMSLMLIAHAEGRHPALAANDYNIIQGRPAKKSDAMLRDFMSSGGKVEWHKLSDTEADAIFSHPQGGTVRISWDHERAKAAGLGGKDNWKKYPRQMLRARVVSEGVRTVCPMATSGMYVPEEVQDFDPPPKVVTIEQEVKEPEKKADPNEKLIAEAKEFAKEIELSDSSEKLEAVVKRFVKTTGALAKNLPKWHERILAVIQQQRNSFELINDPLPDAMQEGSVNAPIHGVLL